MATRGFLGIDIGTQGLSVLFTNEQLKVVASGEADYEMLPDLAEGCYEQQAEDWESALGLAMERLRNSLPSDHAEIEILSIGISGQMHGEVLTDAAGTPLAPVRLWCDSRNEQEGDELTQLLGVKMPKRITAARWLWTLRNQPQIAKKTAHLSTPAGWIGYRLTGVWALGIGDASGMFPIDQQTLKYDERLLEKFHAIADQDSIRPLAELLPTVRRAGEDAGTLNHHGAKLLGLPLGIPVAPAEGDQPAALAGSLIGEPGMVSVSFGTSVAANSVGDRAFQGVSKSIDHFCAPDGKPINMVWLRNGTTYMNTVVEMFGAAIGGNRDQAFAAVMPQVLDAPADCGGLFALPFMDDEPGLDVRRGGTATIVGFNPSNAHPGNAVKAALLSTMFNLRLGSEQLDTQGFPRTELILTGGLTKTPELAQLLADVFNTRVTLLPASEEGTAWGAALLAKYRDACLQGKSDDWTQFLAAHAGTKQQLFEPHASTVKQLKAAFLTYKKLMTLQQALDESLAE